MVSLLLGIPMLCFVDYFGAMAPIELPHTYLQVFTLYAFFCCMPGSRLKLRKPAVGGNVTTLGFLGIAPPAMRATGSYAFRIRRRKREFGPPWRDPMLRRGIFCPRVRKGPLGGSFSHIRTIPGESHGRMLSCATAISTKRNTAPITPFRIYVFYADGHPLCARTPPGLPLDISPAGFYLLRRRIYCRK